MSGASPGDGCDKLTKDSCLGSLISVRFAGVGMSKLVLLVLLAGAGRRCQTSPMEVN